MKTRLDWRAALHLCAAIAIAFFLLALPAFGQNGYTAYTTGNEVSIEVIAPKIIKDLSPWPPPLVSTSGWPLSIRLSSDLHKSGRGLSTEPMPFPVENGRGWMVFSDPDGCPSYGPSFKPGCGGDFNLRPKDEALLEFTPGTYAKPEMIDDLLKPTGTGANPALPGLIVIANRGAGVIAGAAPAYADMGRRNLANYFKSIGFALGDACTPGKPCLSSLTAQLVVPRNFLSPVIVMDQNYGVKAFCPNEGRFDPPNTNPPVWPPSGATAAYREVGGQLFVFPGTILQLGWMEGISTKLEIQVVAVNGPAPDTLPGFKAGDSLADYLRGKGYALLSNVEKATIELYFNSLDRLNVVFADLEAAPNGYFKCGQVAPAAALDREEPPR